MFRWLIRAALGALATGNAAALFAQATAVPPLPQWQDQQSVYLTMSESTTSENTPNEKPTPPANLPDAFSETTAIDQVDLVAPAATETIPASAAPPDNNRRLAPPRSNWSDASESATQPRAAASAESAWRSFGLPQRTISKIGSALAIVLGLFLLFAWLLRRGARSVASTLPADVVCVLGRVPLAARQFADLLHVGNKLVLVASSPAGPATLTEVTDPVEVDRLVGLCRQADPHSTTKAFEQVIRQMVRDPAPNTFLGNEALPATFVPSLDAFQLSRGDAPRA
jgi:flagellar biogenesis protein FliO